MVYKKRKTRKSKKSRKTSTKVGKYPLKSKYKNVKNVQKLSYKDSPFPPVLMTKMKYSDYIRVTTSTNGTSTAVFALNDIYDPVTSGWNVNGQPFYHDQLLSSNGPYYRYTVYGAKVKILIANNSSSGDASCLINWAAGANYTTPASPQAMVQYSGEANSVLFGNLGPTGNDSSLRVFKKYIDIAKTIGVTRKQLFADDRYSGTYNSSPVQTVSLQLVSSNDSTSASSSSDVGYVAYVVFYVKCWGLMPLVPAS